MTKKEERRKEDRERINALVDGISEMGSVEIGGGGVIGLILLGGMKVISNRLIELDETLDKIALRVIKG